MGFFVYILRCSDDSFYVGHTDDLEKRFGEHQTGFFGGYTSTRLPVTVVFAQEFPTRDEAIAMEMRLKGWTRAKKQALIDGKWNELKRLARGTDRK